MTASEMPVSQAAEGRAPAHAVETGRRELQLRRWAIYGAWVLGVVVAFVCYLRLAWTKGVDSDGASNALQAWDMLHGDVLLRGWSVSDVSFYTTELPQYMLIELVRGLNSSVVHVAAAMTYTLAVVLAALLAKGRATGREALVRVGIAAGIMLVPQLASGVNVLMSSPDHIGTTVPVMVVWLILDHARPRWYIPVIAGALLGWAEVADALVLYIGVLPLAVVCAVRVYRAVVIQRQPFSAQWYEVALGVAALVGAIAALLALHLIHASGGFHVRPSPTRFIQGGDLLPRNLGITFAGLLLLGGADFFGMRLAANTLFTLLHVVGVILAGWGTWLAARRFLRDRDLVVQVLVAGILINLAAYVFSLKAHTLTGTREIAAVLPYSAALAGRLLAGRLMAAKLVPVLAVVLAGYLLGAVYEVSHPPAAPQNQQLTSWLEAHHLHTGLSGYWESNVVTLTSGDRVQVRMVTPAGRRLVAAHYESKAAWYNPHQASASFVVLSSGIPGYPGFTYARAAVTTFGKPARIYRVGRYQVLVWNQNLLIPLRHR
jgi:hypothetical protein